MTIENLISRNEQSSRINDYMLHNFNTKTHCVLTNGLQCRSYSPTTNIGIETSLIQGEISTAITKPAPLDVNNKSSDTNSKKTSNMFLKTSEHKEHKSVKSEQTILDRLNKNIIPYHSTKHIPRNQLFGMNTRSEIKYSK